MLKEKLRVAIQEMEKSMENPTNPYLNCQTRVELLEFLREEYELIK